MHRSKVLPAALAAVSFILAATGCSFSDSSRSSAASSESSTSSSSSSGKGSTDKAKASYADDVASLTNSVAGTGMTAAAFSNAIARTAQRFSIADWGGEKATFTGVGKGLRKAGIARDRIAVQPFLSDVLKANKNALKWIGEGFGN